MSKAKSFGHELRLRRLKMGMNISELAEISGVYKTAIQRFERGIGTADMKLKTLFKICQATGLSLPKMAYLICRTQHQYRPNRSAAGGLKGI